MARDSSPADTPVFGGSSPFDGADLGRRDGFVSPRERAFALHCEGLRSPAIGRRINVPARTVRAWLQQDIADLARQSQAKRPERLALAVERHLAVAAAAWDAYHRAAEYDDLALEGLRSAQGDPEATRTAPKLSAATVRSLATALAAQREVARLQGLHTYKEEPADQGHLHLLLRDDDEVVVRPEEMEAWIAFRDAYPRDTDRPRPDDDHENAAEMANTPAPSAPDAMPDGDDNAAEMATPATTTGDIPQDDARTAARAADHDEPPLFDDPPLFEDVDLSDMDWRERARAGLTLIPFEEWLAQHPDPDDPDDPDASPGPGSAPDAAAPPDDVPSDRRLPPPAPR